MMKVDKELQLALSRVAATLSHIELEHAKTVEDKKVMISFLSWLFVRLLVRVYTPMTRKDLDKYLEAYEDHAARVLITEMVLLADESKAH